MVHEIIGYVALYGTLIFALGTIVYTFWQLFSDE